MQRDINGGCLNSIFDPTMTPLKKLIHKARHSFFLFGLASILWFVFRTGSKPTRMSYPCQQASAASGSLWLAAYVLPFILAIRSQGCGSRGKARVLAGFLLLLLSSLFVLYGSYSIMGLAEVAGEDTAVVGRGETILINLSQMHSQFPESSDIFVAAGTSGNDDAVKRLIKLMHSRGLPFYAQNRSIGIIDKDDVVIIKVNSQWNERGGTNSDLVKLLVQAILDHPQGFAGEVVIADNGQGQYGSTGSGGSLSYDRNNAENIAQSMQAVADSFPDQKVSTYLWDRITNKKVGEYADGDMSDGYILSGLPDEQTEIAVTYPKFQTKYGTYISFKHGVWDAVNGSYDSRRLKVLNVPVLKTHAIYGVTACIKHYMGVVSDRLSREAGGRAHNSVVSGGMGTQMAQTRFPDLNILDAIWINANPRGGPSTSYDEGDQAGIIAASIDPVALDYWAAKNILMPVAREKGYDDLKSLDPDNISPGSFGDWLRLSSAEIQKAGHSATVSEKSMNVYLA
ncbi:MAG: hypothetical protein QG575_1579 [Euryarchaeota archaeon]|nr:hypothetical protein [Euryarchaeota archaeon]